MNPAIGPWRDAVRVAEQVLDSYEDATVFQIFECDHCGAMQRNPEPDSFNEVGTCNCGAKTDLRARGCGFFAVIGNKEDVINAAFEDACGGKPKGLPS
jgi:hypothetical protein